MKVNFFAPMNTLGYGIHSFNTIFEFEKLGHQVTLIPPFGQVSVTGPDIERWLAGRERFDKNAASVMIFNEDYLTQFSGDIRIGFPVFETDKFTAVQLAAMKSCNAILTPSAWGERVLKANGIRKIYVVHEGFDPVDFPKIEVSETEENLSFFTFVHVGKFEKRKGTLDIVECFYESLENENARLILHIDNPFLKNYNELLNLIGKLGFKNYELTPHIWRRAGLSIHLTEPFHSHEGIANLYKGADCGIYPSKAEGWGLPILETIATGVPVIAGNWTGQSEYLGHLPKSYPFFLHKFTRETAVDNMFFRGDRGEWNVPDQGEMIEMIRLAFQTGREYRKTSAWQSAVTTIRDNFTWKQAALQLEAAIKDVWGI